tara:strand:+ start:105 stop:485 length:381 start_codon:yes stop_codon:yes gene_type:complete
MNNFKNNHRRGRFKPNGDRSFRRNGNGNKPNGEFGNGSAFKRRHPGKNNQNAAKLIEKYNDLAREALSNGDKILSENYLQHSEHFSRILISHENSRIHNSNESDVDVNNRIKVETQNKETEDTTSK